MSRVFSTLMLMLAGCADLGDRGSYPSLAKRPIETAKPAEQASVAPVVPVNLGPLSTQLEEYAARAQKGDAAFNAIDSDVAQKVAAASGSAVDSENWVVAHQALGRLESARNESVNVLASLDTLYADRMKAIADGREQGGAEAIDTVRRTVVATVDRQNDRIDELRARLREP